MEFDADRNRLVSAGIGWYWLVSVTIYRYRLVSVGIVWYRSASAGFRWYRAVSVGIDRTSIGWHGLVWTGMGCRSVSGGIGRIGRYRLVSACNGWNQPVSVGISSCRFGRRRSISAGMIRYRSV